MGVGRTKLGSVVPTVSVADEKNDRTSSRGSTGAVALLMGYSPIMGGSLESIPRLQSIAIIIEMRPLKIRRKNETYLKIEYTVLRKALPIEIYLSISINSFC